jgi:hypothetical protein
MTMGSTTVRIKIETREALRQLAQESDEPMQEVLARAVEAYRRQRFLERTNEAFAALRADPIAWQTEVEERAIYDGALMDGLEDECDQQDRRGATSGSWTSTQRADMSRQESDLP